MGSCIIWGSKTKNNCQEQDLREALERKDVDVNVWTPNNNGKAENELFFIRNLFYSYMKTYDSKNEPNVVKKLRKYEQKNTFLNSVDGLIQVRDKLKMDEVLRKLKVPHIKTYELHNESSWVIDWINETSDRFSNGVIIKDRFGGMGKGIIRAKKQGSLYLCDISCVDGLEQEYVNESLSKNDLKELFSNNLADYKLIGQPYIKSNHEFKTVKESESIRVVSFDENYISMRRVAESPINNLSLSKNKAVKGGAIKTQSTDQEKEFSSRISQELGLFLAGYDFIRTNLDYYKDDSGALYLPREIKKRNDVSLLLEVNGIVQYGGIQELYKDEFNISDMIAESIKNRT